MATPNGAFVAWMLKRLGFANQQRINGPDLMWKYCALAASRGEAVFFYGGMQETLTLLQARLLAWLKTGIGKRVSAILFGSHFQY